MKKNILLGSVGIASLATLIAITGVVFVDSTHQIAVFTKTFATAGYLGLLSGVTFFVGAVYPKD